MSVAKAPPRSATLDLPSTSGETSPKKFGTFAGVFTPTLLTTLGVIMYLRLPWVIGNAGLLGGWLIMATALAITTATGLSLSVIATNTRLRSGGPYAIIANSLGLEVGGSVGVPLYLSQALAVAMYIFGFREGWTWIFPQHPAIVVDLATFGVIFVIALLSTSLAFKIQYLVIVVIAVSLFAVFGNRASWSVSSDINWWGGFAGSPENGFSGTSFWPVFAVFFPAATGVMAGANMSGELAKPRRSIPLGTLSAIAISTAVYFALAYWASRVATPEELVSNYNVMIDRLLFPPLVVAGLLAATFSSALASLVGAPRILMALARDELVPGSRWFGTVSSRGEPRRATFVTGALVLGALMMRNLNVIAPFITMFFLISYAVINLVLLIESSLGLMSFRPTFKLPRVVPLLGVVGCTFAMFIVNPSFSLVAWAVVLAIYMYILRRGVNRPIDDVRSGLFVAFAEWAASRVTSLNMETARGWKPNLLVPVADPAQLRGEFRLIEAVVKPEGSVKLLGLATNETVTDLTPRIAALGRALRSKDIFTTWSVLDTAGYTTGIVTGLQALGSAFFRPNVLMLTLSDEIAKDVELRQVIRESKRLEVGLVLLGMHPHAATGRELVVNLWVSPRSGAESPIEGWSLGDNLNLAVLIAYRLSRAWHCQLNLISVVEDEQRIAPQRRYIDELREYCRIPKQALTRVVTGDFKEYLGQAPQSDMDVLGMPRDPDDIDFLRETVKQSRSSCIFTQDSGHESALA